MELADERAIGGMLLNGRLNFVRFIFTFIECEPNVYDVLGSENANLSCHCLPLFWVL
jgi:hypothetical protein